MAQSNSSPGTHQAPDLPPMQRERGASPVFIAEQTAGSVLRNTVTLYRSNFRPLFLTFALPTFPVLAAQHVAQMSQNVPLFVVIYFVGLVVSLFAAGAITVTISDICLGNRPSVHRSYAKLLEGTLWLRLLMTNLLQILIIFVGLMLLIIPGLLVMIRVMFTANVVVLERRAGSAALKRSLFLSKGHFWRLLGIFLLLMIAIICVMMVVMVVLGLGVPLLNGVAAGYEEYVITILIPILIQALIQVVLYPLIIIAIVLMYYDLRARKEAYDLAALSEDMMR